jgi:hypothetical protein
MDTVTQIQSYLLAHQYEGLIKKSNLRRGRWWRLYCLVHLEVEKEHNQNF